jgi:membrane protein
VSLLLGLEVNAELERERAIVQGLPEDVEPFAESRDTRKLSDDERQRAERVTRLPQPEPRH